MALDAGPFMRTRTRGSPSWPTVRTERPDTFVQTVQAEQLKPLADGACHTFATPIPWYKATANVHGNGARDDTVRKHIQAERPAPALRRSVGGAGEGGESGPRRP